MLPSLFDRAIPGGILFLVSYLCCDIHLFAFPLGGGSNQTFAEKGHRYAKGQYHFRPISGSSVACPALYTVPPGWAIRHSARNRVAMAPGVSCHMDLPQYTLSILFSALAQSGGGGFAVETVFGISRFGVSCWIQSLAKEGSHCVP